MSRREADAETLAEGVLAGEKRAIARAISLVEDRDPVGVRPRAPAVPAYRAAPCWPG